MKESKKNKTNTHTHPTNRRTTHMVYVLYSFTVCVNILALILLSSHDGAVIHPVLCIVEHTESRHRETWLYPAYMLTVTGINLIHTTNTTSCSRKKPKTLNNNSIQLTIVFVCAFAIHTEEYHRCLFVLWLLFQKCNTISMLSRTCRFH